MTPPPDPDRRRRAARARGARAPGCNDMPMLELVGVPRRRRQRAARRSASCAPALVLMDIHMPGMTGLDVLRALARRRRRSPGRPSSSPPPTTSTRSPPSSCTRSTTCSSRSTRDRFEEAVRACAAAATRASERTLSALEGARSGRAAPLTRLLVRDQGKIVPVLVEDDRAPALRHQVHGGGDPAAAPISCACRSPASRSGSIRAAS